MQQEEPVVLEQLEIDWKIKEQLREEEFKRTELEYAKLKVISSYSLFTFIYLLFIY